MASISPFKSSDRSAQERVTFACDFAQARQATEQLREFLAAHGVSGDALFHCELCLAEACNNAVQHVGDAGRALPVLAEVTCVANTIELRVTDHTAGFHWPDQRLSPPPPDAESGRGLFLIQSLMDEANYVCGPGENVLIMRKLIGL
jgi:anti-sigma regulatory factor (Ser/Thr protein kinase)